jgi:hypothetical protein
MGRIDGTTEIKACFTTAGKAVSGGSSVKQTFQYRVVVAGEAMRRIAPEEDMEILETVTTVICPVCHSSFQSKPGAAGKARGLCQCGNWICPICLCCQEAPEGGKNGGAPTCPSERKRVVRKVALEKKNKRVDVRSKTT